MNALPVLIQARRADTPSWFELAESDVDEYVAAGYEVRRLYARGAALPDAQVLDIAKRCGVKGSGAALVEFAALVREAEPLAAGDAFGKTEILHRSGGQVDPCMALPHVRTAEPTPNTAGSAAGIDLSKRLRDAWISVTDRLPANGEAVLVMADSWERPAVLVYGDQPYQRFVDRRAGLWFWYPERMHWMALPELPKRAGDTGERADGGAA